MNFFEFNKQFPTEVDCIKYFITIRYNNQIKCNHCNSDEFKGYNILGKKTSHIHLRVDHIKEYAASGNIHTNNIENFWGTLKRGILGIYHHISPQHLQKYVDEFCFRYNNRSNGSVFKLVLKQAIL